MTVSAKLPGSTLPSITREAGAEAQSILKGPAYRFCHDPKYAWTDGEAQWCSAIGERNDRCEALPRACQGEMTRAVPRPAKGTWQDQEPFVLRLPNIGPIGSYLLFAAIAVAVAVVARLIFARAFGRREKTVSDEPGAEAPTSEVTAKKSAIEIDVQRLLDRARRAAADERFADGIADAYAALLRQLEGERLLRIDPWRTNGDYLRDLAKRPDVRAEVGPVVRTVESVQFGREAATRESFDSFLGQISALLASSTARSSSGAGLAATAVACFVLSLVSCSDMIRPRGPEEDSPSGASAVVELLRRSGLEPRMRFRSLSKEIEADEVVLLPGARVDHDAWQALLRWVSEGGTLIVANRDDEIVAQSGVRFSTRPGLKMLLEIGEPVSADLAGASVVVPGTNEVVVPDALDPETLLSRDGSVYAARFDYQDGSIVTLADGYLFTNVSVAVADNAAFLVTLLQGDEKKIDLVGELTGNGSKSPLSSVERGKLAPVLLQLGLVLVLFFLYKGVAFGTLTDPPSAKRRSFAEHARALGLLYAKAHASAHARSTYGAYALERLRDSMLFREQKGIAALAEVVAARSGQPIGQVTLTLVEAQEPVPLDPKVKGSQDDLEIIRRLSRLLRQSKGGSK